MLFRLLFLVLILLAYPVAAQQVFSGVVSHVWDGDTLWVRADAGGPPAKLRVDGIDAPELCQPGGMASRLALSQLALHQRVTVSVRMHDSYGRGLARIEREGVDLGAKMVRDGQAWSYRWRSDMGPYAQEEARARRLRLGLLAIAPMEHPRDFRKRHGPCARARR